MRFVPMITKHGSQEQAANAKDAELLTRERLCRALSMFEVVLQKMRAFLKKDPVRLIKCCVRHALTCFTKPFRVVYVWIACTHTGMYWFCTGLGRWSPSEWSDEY